MASLQCSSAPVGKSPVHADRAIGFTIGVNIHRDTDIAAVVQGGSIRLFAYCSLTWHTAGITSASTAGRACPRSSGSAHSAEWRPPTRACTATGCPVCLALSGHRRTTCQVCPPRILQRQTCSASWSIFIRPATALSCMAHLMRCVNTAAAPGSLRRNTSGVILNGKSTRPGPGPVLEVRTAPDGGSATDYEAHEDAVMACRDSGTGPVSARFPRACYSQAARSGRASRPRTAPSSSPPRPRRDDPPVLVGDQQIGDQPAAAAESQLVNRRPGCWR